MTAPLWAVVPAAGVGQRMQAGQPKQYLPVAGRALGYWSLQCLLQVPGMVQVVVAVQPQDPYWAQQMTDIAERVYRVEGGATRAQSVLAGLMHLTGHSTAQDHDWVVVHDMARPCITVALIQRLLHSCMQHRRGGLLALPVTDTVKFSTDGQYSQRTLERKTLWLAQTPQCYPLGLLRKAFQHCMDHALTVTDEASAVEQLGYASLLVLGDQDNIKVTYPEDLQRATQYWQLQSVGPL